MVELVTDRVAGREALQLQAAAWSIAFAVALKYHLRGEELSLAMPSQSHVGPAPRPGVLPGSSAEDANAHIGEGPLRLLNEQDRLTLACSKSAPLYALARLRQTVRQCTAGSGEAVGINLYRVHEQMVSALTGCERILRTPCPPGYVGMLRAVMMMWLCFLPFTLIEAMGFFMVPICSITTFVVLKLEQLAVEIENPFGLDFNDLPLEAFCLTVEADALRLLAEFDADKLAEAETRNGGNHESNVGGREVRNF